MAGVCRYVVDDKVVIDWDFRGVSRGELERLCDLTQWQERPSSQLRGLWDFVIQKGKMARAYPELDPVLEKSDPYAITRLPDPPARILQNDSNAVDALDDLLNGKDVRGKYYNSDLFMLTDENFIYNMSTKQGSMYVIPEDRKDFIRANIEFCRLPWTPVTSDSRRFEVAKEVVENGYAEGYDMSVGTREGRSPIFYQEDKMIYPQIPFKDMRRAVELRIQLENYEFGWDAPDLPDSLSDQIISPHYQVFDIPDRVSTKIPNDWVPRSRYPTFGPDVNYYTVSGGHGSYVRLSLVGEVAQEMYEGDKYEKRDEYDGPWVPRKESPKSLELLKKIHHEDAGIGDLNDSNRQMVRLMESRDVIDVSEGEIVYDEQRVEKMIQLLKMDWIPNPNTKLYQMIKAIREGEEIVPPKETLEPHVGDLVGEVNGRYVVTNKAREAMDLVDELRDT